jgi:hypothetical protein
MSDSTEVTPPVSSNVEAVKKDLEEEEGVGLGDSDCSEDWEMVDEDIFGAQKSKPNKLVNSNVKRTMGKAPKRNPLNSSGGKGSSSSSSSGGGGGDDGSIGLPSPTSEKVENAGLVVSNLRVPLMHIVILVCGTRGDVQPFLIIGQKLKVNNTEEVEHIYVYIYI